MRWRKLGGSGFEHLRGGAGCRTRIGQFLVADEPALRQVATITGGTYFPASGEGQLQTVLSDLPQQAPSRR